jgi:hypothetical protein
LNGKHGQVTTYAGLDLDSNVSNITSINNNENLSDDGASLFEISASYNYKINDKSFIKAYGTISNTDYSTSNSKTITTESSDYNTSTTGDIDNNSYRTELKTEKKSQTENILKLGFAYNLKPSNDVLLVLASEYTQTNEKTSYSNSTEKNELITKVFVDNTTTNTVITNGTTGNTTPNQRSVEITTKDISIVIASEIAITDKFDIRFGLRESVYYNRDEGQNHNSYNTTYTNDDNTTVTNNSTTTSSDTSSTVNDGTDNTSDDNDKQPQMQIALGFGYKITKNVQLDGLVNANLFLEGPNFVSGQQLENISGRLAINYKF